MFIETAAFVYYNIQIYRKQDDADGTCEWQSRENKAMKLKTRLMTTFLLIILLPVALVMLVYGVMKLTMKQNFRNLYGVENVSISLLSNPVKGFSALTRTEHAELKDVAQTRPEQFSDISYLDLTNERLMEKASYLIVVCDGEFVYQGDVISEEVADVLMQDEDRVNFGDYGYYLDGENVLLKKVIFSAGDETTGRAYIITKIRNIVSGGLLIGLGIIILIVLLITSVFLTGWVRRGVFVPLTELNTAMQHIADGDFDYVMVHDGKGEIAELYENYNQMRLRLKESIEENVQADRQNRELISNISHDLKTPITSIKGYVEGIMDGVADTPEKMDRYIKTIYNKTNDMNRLINELTIYSGIDSNRIPYNFRKLFVADYFNDCVEEVGLDLESKNIRLNYTNMVTSDTCVIADPEQLKRVVNNIIGNSVKYMNKPDSVIDIRILDENDSVRVEIEDNGKGVSPKEIGRIFERFYRTDASRNSSQGGSGIGLSIVKKIIEDHGGYIWATSKENEGTCMHFVLRKYVGYEDR